jgi:hypothetical protein
MLTSKPRDTRDITRGHAMNTAAARRVEIRLSPHLMARLWRAVAVWWARHLECARTARELDFLSDLNPKILRDIGVPEQLVSHAEARRESLRLRQFDLRQWRDG